MALSFGGFLTQLVGLACGIVLARLLTREDLATYRQTFLAYNFAAPLLTLALPSALYFFLPQRPGQERTVLVGNLLLLTSMGLLFSLFLLLGGAHLLAWRFHNQALEQTLLLLAPYPLFALPAAAVEACLVSRGQVSTLTVFNVCSRLLLGAATVVSCFWFRRPQVLVLVNVALTGLLLAPALWLMLRACPGEVQRPDRQLLWSMVKYSVPVGLATVLGSLTLQLSNVVVSALCSPTDFAVYSVGAFELPLIGIVTGSITTVILADMSQLCQEGRHDEALRLFRTAAARAAAILFPTFVFFLITAEPFIESLFSAKYAQSVAPFRLYLFTLPVRIVTYGAALMALGLSRVILFRSIIDLSLNAMLCWLFVHFFGYLGAVAALLVTLAFWHVPYNLHAIAKGFRVPTRKVLPFALLGRVFLLSVVAAPFALLSLLPLSLPKVLELFLAALLYWPIIMYGSHRMHLLPIAGLLQQMSPRVAGFLSKVATS